MGLGLLGSVVKGAVRLSERWLRAARTLMDSYEAGLSVLGCGGIRLIQSDIGKGTRRRPSLLRLELQGDLVGSRTEIRVTKVGELA